MDVVFIAIVYVYTLGLFLVCFNESFPEYGGFRKVRDFFVAPDFTTHAEYRRAEEWLHSTIQGANIAVLDADEIERAYEYAKERLAEEYSRTDNLDKKAHELLVINGPTLAVLGGLSAWITTHLAISALQLSPAFVLLTVAACLLVHTRNIKGQSRPVAADRIIQAVTSGHVEPKLLRLTLAATLHTTHVGAAIVNDWTAEKIQWAYRIYLTGIVALSIPLLLAALRRFTQ